MRNNPAFYFFGDRVASLAQLNWALVPRAVGNTWTKKRRGDTSLAVDRKRPGAGTHHPSLLEGFSLAAPLALSQETVRMHHDPEKASRYENPCMRLEDLIDLTFAFDEPVLSTTSSRPRRPDVHVNSPYAYLEQ